MNFSFRLKIIIVFVLFSICVSILSLYLIYTMIIKSQMEDFRNSLLMTSALGAELIDGDAHKQIKLERNSINTSFYQYVKRKLQFIREANSNIRYIYTLHYDPLQKRFFFAVDSTGLEHLFSYPGDIYETAFQEQILAAFEKPWSNANLIEDSFGSYMTGFAPIKDTQGNPVALLGLDMSGATIEATKDAVKQYLIAVFILCVLISILIGYFIAFHLSRPINQLVEGTKCIANGDFNRKVDIQTNDEIGKLAQAFNHMATALKESDQRLRSSFLDTIRALTAALEAKDPYTKGHSERVMKYGVAIARALGLPEKEIENLKYLYIMHDIGKIGIGENILNKPEELSPDERQAISEHSEIGGDILAPISFMDAQLMQIVKSHHERQDGTGYPDGLKDTEIPLSVAILTVADAFDAMVTDRPYRKAHNVEYAKNELIKNSGSQFKREVVDAFMKVLDTITSLEDLLNGK
jgi:HD-GYP domain-containing protein (c-di-GMP phosphodiesterase class II)